MGTIVEEREAHSSARRTRLERTLEDVVEMLASMGALRAIVLGSCVEEPLRRLSDPDVLGVMSPTRTGAKRFCAVHDALVSRGISPEGRPPSRPRAGPRSS